MSRKEKNAIKYRPNWPALVTSGARFSVLVHAITYLVVNLLLAGLNGLMVWLLHANWWVVWPLAGWGAALLIHAVAVALAPEVERVRNRIRRPELSFPA